MFICNTLAGLLTQQVCSHSCWVHIHMREEHNYFDDSINAQEREVAFLSQKSTFPFSPASHSQGRPSSNAVSEGVKTVPSPDTHNLWRDNYRIIDSTLFFTYPTPHIYFPYGHFCRRARHSDYCERVCTIECNARGGL